MEKIKQFLKQGAKPILYILIGFILGIAIYTAQAAWDTTVAPTQPLTADLWNDIVAKLVELDLADVHYEHDNCTWSAQIYCDVIDFMCPDGQFLAGKRSAPPWGCWQQFYCCGEI